MNNKKYILIDCYIDLFDSAYEYCKLLQKNGDYYHINLTTNDNQFDVESVTKEKFEEVTK